MFHVYLIRSISFPDQVYFGISTNVEHRLNEHNSGKAKHTSKYKPWNLVMYLSFKNETTARNFEKYLKSCSGRAFAQKRLWY